MSEYIVDNKYTKSYLGDESYPIITYTMTPEGDETYPDTNERTQLYITDPNTQNKRYARKKDGSEFYGTWNNEPVFMEITWPHGPIVQIYARDKDMNEIYPDTSADRVYAVLKKNKTDPGLQRYAKKRDGSEYYATVNGEFIYSSDVINGKRRQRYAKTADNSEIYLVDSEKNEFPAMNELDQLYYAKNAKFEEILPKKADGAEYLIPSQSPRYPVTSDGERYGRNASGDEFYIENGQTAMQRHGVPLYAKTKTGEIIFPTDINGNEYYFQFKGDDLLPGPNPRYAKTASGFQIYPKVLYRNQFTVEFPKGGLYAKDAEGKFYYPADSNGNEFMYGGPLEDYPITTDGKIIIPQTADGRFDFVLKNVNISENNIKEVLYRPHLNKYQDFVTNIKSSRKPRYQYKPYKTKKYTVTQRSNVLYYTVAFLGFMVLLFIIKNMIPSTYQVPQLKNSISDQNEEYSSIRYNSDVRKS